MSFRMDGTVHISFDKLIFYMNIPKIQISGSAVVLNIAGFMFEPVSRSRRKRHSFAYYFALHEETTRLSNVSNPRGIIS